MNEDRLLPLAWRIIDRLEAAGHSAYLVGGYVRDRLLGRPVHDIDIATSALPEQVMSLFDRAEPTGLQHGTVTVILDGAPFEVTTFRTESGYSDRRRPDKVAFITRLEDDLARRDFTMNAMALDRTMQLIDPFGGRSDLAEGRIRCVGDPRLRFDEDALRMLRCIRFAAEYRLQAEAGTWQALLDKAGHIRHIAIERVRTELEKIVEGSHPDSGLRMLAESNLFASVHPAFAFDLQEWTRRGFASQLCAGTLEAEPRLRWPYMFITADVSARTAERWMRDWTFPAAKARAAAGIVALHGHMCLRQPDDPPEIYWKRAVLDCGPATARDWLALVPQLPERFAPSLPEGMNAEQLAERGRSWLSEMPVTSLAELAVRGGDLLSRGYSRGPGIGRALRRLLEMAALGEVDNEPAALLSAADQLREQSE